MDISQTNSQSPAASAPAAQKPKVTSDFNTFLRMLTAQMKHQDPLNPVEATDFATQLATFSGVEQAVLTNDLLRGLMSQTGLADMASWVGKDARAAAPVYFDGSTPVTLYPKPMAGAQSGEIVVRDVAGNIVDRFPAPVSTDARQWTGVGTSGTPLPRGAYSFTFMSSKDGKSLGETGVEIYAMVTEVRSVDGEKQLITQGGIAVPAKNITALRGVQI